MSAQHRRDPDHYYPEVVASAPASAPDELLSTRRHLEATKQEVDRLETQLAEAKSNAEFAWKNTREIDKVRTEAEQERDALRAALKSAEANAYSWEACCRAQNEAKLPCGHPNDCGIDLSEEGQSKWSRIGCVWCQRDKACAEVDRLKEQTRLLRFYTSKTNLGLIDDLVRLREAGDFLWCVLANASGGNWNEQSQEWQGAAAKARDDWFAALSQTNPNTEK